MKLICEKTILADAVAVCIHAVSAKSSIAALEGLLITTGQNSVSLCGYNFKTAIQRSFDATIPSNWSRRRRSCNGGASGSSGRAYLRAPS